MNSLERQVLREALEARGQPDNCSGGSLPALIEAKKRAVARELLYALNTGALDVREEASA